MEEIYVLHELHESQEDSAPEPTIAAMPIEEPCPYLDMELAQAYVRPQPLEGIFPPEEGIRMGTVFPNLSQPYRYGGRGY